MNYQGFSDSPVGKESACNAGYQGLIPGLGRSPGEGKGYQLQYSGLENSTDCVVHGVAKSWVPLSDFHFHNKLLSWIFPSTDNATFSLLSCGHLMGKVWSVFFFFFLVWWVPAFENKNTCPQRVKTLSGRCYHSPVSIFRAPHLIKKKDAVEARCLLPDNPTYT